MKRTQSPIAVALGVLALSIGVYISGSTLFAAGGETPANTDAQAAHDAALAAIKKLDGRIKLDEEKNVTQVKLDTTKIVDADLKHLKQFTKLQGLGLSRTQITDAGLEHLTGLTELASLDLYDTTVSDAGLEHLKGLTKLKFLMLKRTNVTDAGAKKLQRSLPECLISHSPRDPRIAELIPLAGRWSVEFANGVKQTSEIREDGAASVVEGGRISGGLAGVQGRQIVIAYDDQRVERWTVVGKRVVVEHWAPVPGPQRWAGHPPLRPLPTTTPVLGIAERAK